MHRDIVPQIRKIVGDTFKSVISRIDPARLQNTFEVSTPTDTSMPLTLSFIL